MSTCLVPGDRRGGNVLIHCGFRYCRRSITATKFHWACTYSACVARLQTNKFDYSTENIVGLYQLLFCMMLLARKRPIDITHLFSCLVALLLISRYYSHSVGTYERSTTGILSLVRGVTFYRIHQVSCSSVMQTICESFYSNTVAQSSCNKFQP